MNFTVVQDGPQVLSLYEGFFSGGARIHHTAVVRALDATTSQRHRVLSLTNRVQREFTAQAIENDTSYRRLAAAGVPVQALDRCGSEPFTATHQQLARQAVRRADVLLSLKEQPLSLLAEIGTQGRPLLVCLHRSDPEHSGAALESLVDLYERGLLTAGVCCAQATQRAYHEATGIPLDRLPVIPNGVDLHKFRRDEDQRRRVRAQLAAPEGSPVVLIAARFDEMKDIPLFVRAAAVFRRIHPDAHFVLCGAGMTWDNPAFEELVARELGSWEGLSRQLHPLGIQTAMAPLYAAADVVALTSAYGEAAPLCLLEGMAAGAVPVTTDVGDAASMVGDQRLVVDRDPAAVAVGWAAAFERRDEHRERIARNRQRLSDQVCFDRYAALIAAHAPAPAY